MQFFPVDYECISSLTTFNYLTYLCQRDSNVPNIVPDIIKSGQARWAIKVHHTLNIMYKNQILWKLPFQVITRQLFILSVASVKNVDEWFQSVIGHAMWALWNTFVWSLNFISIMFRKICLKRHYKLEYITTELQQGLYILSVGYI